MRGKKENLLNLILQIFILLNLHPEKSRRYLVQIILVLMYFYYLLG